MMAGIGATGMILIAVVALILFGPSKLPELGKAFGRTIKEFKSGTRELMAEETLFKEGGQKASAEKR